MSFDTTVTLGNIIQIILLCFAIASAYITLTSQVRIQEERQRSDRKQHEQLSLRVDRIERQIDDEIETLRKEIGDGLRRIYDKLDHKQDKI